MKLFADHAAKQLPSDVATLIHELQPPMAQPQMDVYNSTSTGISTVSGPAPSFTDIRTM